MVDDFKFSSGVKFYISSLVWSMINMSRNIPVVRKMIFLSSKYIQRKFYEEDIQNYIHDNYLAVIKNKHWKLEKDKFTRNSIIVSRILAYTRVADATCNKLQWRSGNPNVQEVK